MYLYHPACHAAELMAALDGRCAYMISNVPSDFHILRFCETGSNFIFKNHSYLFLICGFLSHMIFRGVWKRIVPKAFLFFVASEKPWLESFILVILGKQGPVFYKQENCTTSEILESTFCPCSGVLFIFRSYSELSILISLPQFEEAIVKCQWVRCVTRMV